MRTISISVKNDAGVLAFGLRDLLTLISEQAADVQWVVTNDLECSGDRADELEVLASSGTPISSGALAALAGGILQVINGGFYGYESDRSSPTIILRSIDSSWWDVASDREDILDVYREHFGAVLEAGDVY